MPSRGRHMLHVPGGIARRGGTGAGPRALYTNCQYENVMNTWTSCLFTFALNVIVAARMCLARRQLDFFQIAAIFMFSVFPLSCEEESRII